eukprot:3583051-Rhodomonas_salina.1
MRCQQGKSCATCFGIFLRDVKETTETIRQRIEVASDAFALQCPFLTQAPPLHVVSGAEMTGHAAARSEGTN